MINYFTGFENLSGDFTVHEYGEEQCPSGYGFGPYIRQTYFIHYIYSGKGIFRAEGKEYRLKAGQIFLILPGQLTYYEADKDDPWHYRWISFDGGYSEVLLRSAGLSIQSPIYTDDEHGSAGKALEVIVQNGIVPFCQLMSEFWSFADSLLRGKRPIADSYVRRAKAHIHSHYMEPLSIGEIAAGAGIDRSYLSRLFKDSEGISPQEYLIRYRLHLAKTLLLETDYNVSSVARLVGYSDALDFSKRFKSRFGLSPLKWRKEKRSLSPHQV
ncbi:MAG: AraC family transcriptional regulator [Oscillospiraceae bacterium]|nr:AraC family transcriptional regulator [Oscillospiraceae bacterium]